MKITIAYRASEDTAAEGTVAAIRQLFPETKIKSSERHPPFKHVYITVGDRAVKKLQK